MHCPFNVWDIKEGKSKKSIPVFEVHKIISEYVVCMIMCLCSIEAVVLIPNNASLAIEAKDNSTLIATAGEKGKVYVLKGQCIRGKPFKFFIISQPVK